VKRTQSFRHARRTRGVPSSGCQPDTTLPTTPTDEKYSDSGSSTPTVGVTADRSRPIDRRRSADEVEK